jgi:serine phosphatase RsbU (regulator of sigma subunit)
MPVPCWLRSPAIGMLPKANWSVGTTEIPQGGRLYVFSDGASRSSRQTASKWVIEDLRQVLKGPEIPGLSEAQRLYQAVRAAARPGPLEDDFSALVVSFK